MLNIETQFSNILIITLQVFVPIALAAIAGAISERSGIINLGLEGMMLIGAFASTFGSYATGSPYIGVLLAILGSILMGLLHGVFCIRLKAHQSVVGVGINIFAAGLTAVFLKLLWGNEGMSPIVNTIPNVTIPFLSKIPFIRAFFNNQSIFLYITLIISIVSYIIIYKTKVGLRLRAIGDNPHSAQTAGINVNKYRYVAVVISSVIAGLGGSYLSISLNNLFVKDMVAGRGFMGLAANIFGGWHPIGAIISSFIFSLAQALRFNLTVLNIPNQFIEMIPYAVTLLVLIMARRKSKSPEALGKNDI
jgi:general nucleoside transport system permease protein